MSEATSPLRLPASAMEPAWQKVQHEAADELVGAECHDARPVPAIAAIILVAEGDARRVEGEQSLIRDGGCSIWDRRTSSTVAVSYQATK
jgi:hypothetical protein